MKLRTRIAAAGFAAAVLLSPVVANSAQANVPVAGPLVPAAAPSSQATAAADWIAAQWTANQSLSNGSLADAITSMVATGLHGDVVDQMNAKLKTQAPAYATGAGSAGKVAIAAQALGEDPTNYGGVDLIQKIQDSLATSPNGGGMFNLPYAVIALVRAGETVPQASIDAFVNAQDASGAFGYQAGGFVVDVDSTGVAITALVGLEQSGQGGQDVSDALDAVLVWAAGSQSANGSWPGFSPANATAMVGQGLIAAGEDVSDAVAYLVDQQTKAGGAGLPSAHNGTSPNMIATIQGLLLLAGDDLLNAPAQDDDGNTTDVSTPVTTPPASSSAPTTSQPTTSQPTTDPTSSAPSTDKPSTLPNTGDESSPLALLLGLGVVATGATALVANRRRR